LYESYNIQDGFWHLRVSQELSGEMGELGSKAVEWEEAFTIPESGSDLGLATAN